MGGHPKSDGDVKEDLRMLFQVCADDLAFLKEQQWKVTNYGLLLYAVLVGIAKTSTSKDPWEAVFLYIATVVVFSAGYLILEQLQRSIDKGRDRMHAVRRKLSADFNAAWWSGQKPEEEKVKHKPRLFWLFVGTLSIGFFLSCWLIHRT